MTDDLWTAAHEACRRAGELTQRSADLIASAHLVVARTTAADAQALRIAALTRTVVELRAAMASRATIEQAKGVIMASLACDPDAAFEVLVQQSQHENRKLRDVAADLVRSKQRRPA